MFTNISEIIDVKRFIFILNKKFYYLHGLQNFPKERLKAVFTKIMFSCNLHEGSKITAKVIEVIIQKSFTWNLCIIIKI